MNERKIVVFGPSGSGKTTFSAMLAKRLGCEFMNTSDVIKLSLARVLASTNPDITESYYLENFEMAKERWRPALVAHGNELCDANPSYLMDKCAEKARIIVGPRRMKELTSYFVSDNNAPISVKIVRPGIEVKDNYELDSWKYFDFEIENNKDFAHLQAEAEYFIKCLNGSFIDSRFVKVK